jgi:hypothetical protein
LIVLPMVALIALVADRQQALKPLAVWGGIFLLTVLLVWPATWAAPRQVVDLLRVGVAVEGTAPHVIGNYFLGQPVATPGPLFYPAALVMRTTPIALPGLLLLPLAWRWQALTPALRRDLALLTVCVVLFVVAMSLFAKQLTRYLVPVFPALDILAAVGLLGTLNLLGGRLHNRWHAWAGRAEWATVVLVGALALGNAAWWHPYGVVAFNQALGGTPAAARTFLLGDGEGLGQAARWLNAQPDSTGVTIASTMFQSLQPWLADGVQAVSPDDELPANAGYALVYIRHAQLTPTRAPFDQFYPAATPLHVVTIHDVDYVWIYDIPAPIEHAVGARFGPAIELHGYELDDTALRASGTLTLALQWQAQAPPAQEYRLFAHLLDSEGQRYAQIDVPPAGPARPTPAWEPGRYVRWSVPLLAPADLPPGDYWLALGLYDPATLARLPVAQPPPAGAPDAGGNALLVPVTVGR